MTGTIISELNILAISRREYAAAYSLMSDERKKRCDAYRSDDDKKRCIAADLLLRRELGRFLGVLPESLIFEVSDKGKPYLLNQSCHFNISHAGDFVVAAINPEFEVGIDIEKIRPVRASVARHIFSDKDNMFVFGSYEIPEGLIEDMSVLERFFRVWTYKEAYVKMTGEGIRGDMKVFSYDEGNCIFRLSDGYCLTVITAE